MKLPPSTEMLNQHRRFILKWQSCTFNWSDSSFTN